MIKCDDGITAVIPTHRRPELLSEAIESVILQSWKPDHLIVVDDAADPQTRAVVQEQAARAPFPVSYRANPRPGVCHSRNLGARTATTPWIAFLDDDDVWRPNMLRDLRDAAFENCVSLAIGGLLRHERGYDPRPRVQLSGLTGKTALLQPGSMTGSNFIVQKKEFFEVGGFDPEMTVFNDWDLFVRLMDHGVGYVVVDRTLAEWRDHAGDRIATPSTRRATGLDAFVRRYRSRLSPDLLRDFRTTSLGIKRMHAKSSSEWLALTLQLVLAHGFLRSWRKLRASTRVTSPV